MIIPETFQYLEENSRVCERKIRTVRLGNYFTAIELDDGSVGACMSYYRLSLPMIKIAQERITAILSGDPLFLGSFKGERQFEGIGLPHDQEFLLETSLQVTVVSALSAPVLRQGGDATFSVSPCFDPFAGAKHALVLGFGGFMEKLARAEYIVALHIADLAYDARRTEMEAIIARYRQQHRRKIITISNGNDTVQRLREVDAVSITGSAICNGTMDRLLREAKGGPRIIIQGQSAGIHPCILFERGVDVVVTTLKPRTIMERAKLDASAKAMRPFFEGGLPAIYLVPRKDGPRAIATTVGGV